MSILTLHSTNPELSYIISKNPATIREQNKPYHRELRQGQLYGWYTGTDNDTFRLWFKDHPTRSSFADGALSEFEYLDKTRYASPYLPIAILQTAMREAHKSRSEYDRDGFMARVTTTIRVPRPTLAERFIADYRAAGTDVSMTKLSDRYYNVVVQAPTVFEVLNVLQALCVMSAVLDHDTHVTLTDPAIQKYVKTLNNANAPYYLRYHFAKKCIVNRGTFDKFRKELNGPGMVMCYGDTRQQRYDAIQKQMKGGASLIDLGCGEMFYTLRMASKYTEVTALDADEDIAHNGAEKLKGRGVQNATCMHAKVDPEWVETYAALLEGSHILATEVLEHMPRETADELLRALLGSGAEKLVITVPNADFNKYYGMDGQFRHDDHDYEPSFGEWNEYIAAVAADTGWNVETTGIGDSVHGDHTSIMSVFTRPAPAIKE